MVSVEVGAVTKALVRGAGLVGTLAALSAVFGTGPAVAINEYVGQTYNDAANAIAVEHHTTDRIQRTEQPGNAFGEEDRMIFDRRT